MGMACLVKSIAILTVLTANVVVLVCAGLLVQATNCGSDCTNTDTRYRVALIATCVLCILVLVTATLDNVSWWTSSFPDAFMSTSQANNFLDRLSETVPGYKVTIQQDFFLQNGAKAVHKARKKSREMYKPRVWMDSTHYLPYRQLSGTVIKLRLEVSPLDREAREDFDKFINEMVLENSSGEYDRKMLTGICIEARVPKLSVFQGGKIPQISIEKRVDSINIPLSAGFLKIQGDPVRIFVYGERYLSKILCPTMYSLKRVLFLVVLLIPVLGTVLSVVLADNTKHLTVRKRFSRRPNLEELIENPVQSRVLRLLPSPRDWHFSRLKRNNLPRIFPRSAGSEDTGSSSTPLHDFSASPYSQSPGPELNPPSGENENHEIDSSLLEESLHLNLDTEEEAPDQHMEEHSRLIYSRASSISDHPPPYSSLHSSSSPPCYTDIFMPHHIHHARETQVL